MTVGIRRPQTAELAAELSRRARARGALLIASDFDGTLAPIVATPDQARAVPTAALSLRRLADADVPGVRLRVAVVTSRDSDDIARRMPLGERAVVAGNAGLERWTAGRVVLDPEAIPWLEVLGEAAAALDAALAAGRCPGARLERRHCGVVLHTRGTPGLSADAEALDLAREAGSPRGLRPVVGKRTVELRIPVDRNKSHALAALLEEEGWAGAAVVAAGDDLPDVEMLALASSLEGGLAVAVTDPETPAAVLDVAGVAVEGPGAWAQVLTELAASLLGL